ncbi:MAG: YihY/virulence factor BrkB family protein [Cellulomonadaceae bacterium]
MTKPSDDGPLPASIGATGAPDPDDPRKAAGPTDLPRHTWAYALSRSLREFMNDKCTDLAAGLTYYAVLSVAPALLALVSILGVVGNGPRILDGLLDIVRDLGSDQAVETIEPILAQIVDSQSAGLALIAGVLVALWSASNYVNAFSRAMNRIYGVEEGRPVWKLRPVLYALTLGLLILVALVALMLVTSGPIAASIGAVIGLSDTFLTVWGIAKWPVVLLIVIGAVAMLYHLTPNVKQPRLRWITPGAAVAIVVWILASVGFGFYVGNFGSYNATYGALAGVILFLLWLWISNLALLFGAELDAELERVRELRAGLEAEELIQLPPRDTAASEKKAAKAREDVAKAQLLRLRSGDDRDLG